MRLNKRHITIIIIITIYAVFSLISLVNHLQLRTNSLDLGMFNHALYSFAHFKKAIFTLGLDGKEMPFFATHFSPIIILFAPFYYLFGSYTLLVIQIIAVLFGGLSAYKYSESQFSKNSIVPLIILISFYSIWAIYSALSFDYHNNVIGAMLVIWFVYYTEKRRFLLASVFLVLIVATKEYMAIWMVFVISGLMIKNRKRFASTYLRFEIPAIILCIFYGASIIYFVMPSLQEVNTNLQLSRYNILGSSFSEIIYSIYKDPKILYTLLFENTLSNPAYNGIKTEFHFIMLVSGGIVFFYRPVYFLMLLPIYVMKFLSNNYGLWGINYHYSIEFVPIISLATIEFLKRMGKLKFIIAIIFASSTIYFNYNTIEYRVSKWYNPKNTCFYCAEHYKSDYNTAKIYEAFKLIEDNSAISVSACFVPHLANREKIYHFPVIEDSEYLILTLKKNGHYPLNDEEFNHKINNLISSKRFTIIYNKNDLLILKR